MDNSEVNEIRIEAFKKHGPVRIIRLRATGGSIRFYVCKMRPDGDSILTVLAGGISKAEILSQL